MTTVLQTSKSSLLVCDLPDEMHECLTKCVEEVKDHLIDRMPIIVYGKTCHQNRAVGFFSDETTGYAYSNQVAQSIPLTQSLRELMMFINTKFGSEFNGILVNKYSTGTDCIGKHSDSEDSLDASAGVVCVSYGATRKFRIRDKCSGKIIVDVPAESHQIIQMGGQFQREFTHEIPVEKKIKSPRYSFTLRKHHAS